MVQSRNSWKMSEIPNLLVREQAVSHTRAITKDKHKYSTVLLQFTAELIFTQFVKMSYRISMVTIFLLFLSIINVISFRGKYPFQRHVLKPLHEAQKFTSFDDMLEKIDKPVLVDFFALWCGPCKMMVPVLEEIAGRLENDLKVAKIDTDKYPKLGSRFQVEALPTLILFNKGQVVDRFIGYMNADDLEVAVKKVSQSPLTQRF